MIYGCSPYGIRKVFLMQSVAGTVQLPLKEKTSRTLKEPCVGFNDIFLHRMGKLIYEALQAGRLTVRYYYNLRTHSLAISGIRK